MDSTNTRARAERWACSSRVRWIARDMGVPAHDLDDIAQEVAVLALTNARCTSLAYTTKTAAGSYLRSAEPVAPEPLEPTVPQPQEDRLFIRELWGPLYHDEIETLVDGPGMTLGAKARWRRLQRRMRGAA